MTGSKKGRNHYIPQFLLRHFVCNIKKEQIYVFDKQTKKSFRTNISNIVCEKGFYDFELEGVELTIEPALAKLECNISDIHKGIIAHKKLNHLTHEEKIRLLHYVIIQRFRTRAERELIKDMNQKISQKIQNLGADPITIAGYRRFTEHNARLFNIRAITNAHELVPGLLNKTWMLLETDKKDPFYISDNPITLQNTMNPGYGGNLGFRAKGVEIYWPLSRTLALTLMCPSFEEELRSGYQRANEIHANIRTSAVHGQRFGYFDEWGLRASQDVLTSSPPILRVRPETL